MRPYRLGQVARSLLESQELWVRVFPVTNTLPVDDSCNLVCFRVDENIAKRKVVMSQCKITELDPRQSRCVNKHLAIVVASRLPVPKQLVR